MREKNDKEAEREEENQIVIAILIGDSLVSLKGKRRGKEAEDEEREKK